MDMGEKRIYNLDFSMKWTQEAEDAIKKVPFFVRKKVRLRVEQEAAKDGKTRVGPSEVSSTQKRYLNGMAADVKGYQLDICFGSGGCKNRVSVSDQLVKGLEKILQKADLKSFLKAQVGEDLKFHHEFRVTVAECPNACSQPQIKDIGIIGAMTPTLVELECTQCGQCVDSCPDDAIFIDSNVSIDRNKCLACGKCIMVCPAGALCEKDKGYRIQLGGKLGRHPRLAKELPGIYKTQDVLSIVDACLKIYKQKSRLGRRFAEIFSDTDYNALVKLKKGEFL